MEKNVWNDSYFNLDITINQIYKISKLFDFNALPYGAVIVEFIFLTTLGKLLLVSTQLTHLRKGTVRENERDWVEGFVKAYLMSFDDRDEELNWRSHEGITRRDILSLHSSRMHSSTVYLCIRINKDKFVITFSLRVR